MTKVRSMHALCRSTLEEPLMQRTHDASCGARRLAAVLVLLDLDNTLVDRRGAFTMWASDFVAGVDGDTTDLEWLITADQDG